MRDANTCTDTENTTINNIPGFTVDSINTQDETCGGLGAILIYSTGGTNPMEFSVDGGVTFSTSSIFTCLTGGAYNVEIRDANSCTFSQVVNVTTIPPFNLDGVTTDVTCAGLGTATINVSALSATMEYSIDGGVTFQSSNFFTDLTEGSYNVVVRDFNTCSRTQTVNVNNIPPFSVDSVIYADETC